MTACSVCGRKGVRGFKVDRHGETVCQAGKTCFARYVRGGGFQRTIRANRRLLRQAVAEYKDAKKKPA